MTNSSEKKIGYLLRLERLSNSKIRRKELVMTITRFKMNGKIFDYLNMNLLRQNTDIKLTINNLTSNLVSFE